MQTLNTQIKNKKNIPVRREQLTVLIVDKKQVDTVLEKDLKSFGKRVIVAECYKHAIQAATNTRNDLITISMNLSPSDGIQMISKIKDVVGASNVVSTDTNVYEMGQKEKEQQILYYIKKSLEVNDIQSILERISQKKIFSTPMYN